MSFEFDKNFRRAKELADALVAFWDGRSKRTKNMIDLAKKEGLKLKVVMY